MIRCNECKHADWTQCDDEPGEAGVCTAPVGPSMPMCIERIRHPIRTNFKHNCHAFVAGAGKGQHLVLCACHVCGARSDHMWGGIFFCCADHAPKTMTDNAEMTGAVRVDCPVIGLTGDET